VLAFVRQKIKRGLCKAQIRFFLPGFSAAVTKNYNQTLLRNPGVSVSLKFYETYTFLLEIKDE
jgi:hypothetical protein